MAEPTVEFEDNTIKVLDALDNACIAWLIEASGELESQVRRNTKVGKVAGGNTKEKIPPFSISLETEEAQLPKWVQKQGRSLDEVFSLHSEIAAGLLNRQLCVFDCTAGCH